MMLMGYVSDVQDLALETNLNYIGLFVTIIAQEADPWNLYFTVVPVIVWSLIYIGIKIKQKRLPDLNPVKVNILLHIQDEIGFTFYRFGLLLFLLWTR